MVRRGSVTSSVTNVPSRTKLPNLIDGAGWFVGPAFAMVKPRTSTLAAASALRPAVAFFVFEGVCRARRPGARGQRERGGRDENDESPHDGHGELLIPGRNHPELPARGR